MERWGQTIGEAGQQPLTADKLLELNWIVLANVYFTNLGWRTAGIFVGKRDGDTNVPIPDHIGARHQDLEGLVDGLIAYAERSEKGGLDSIVAAAAVAFGFVFIHPFADGNGRIYRWLVDHMLARGDISRIRRTSGTKREVQGGSRTLFPPQALADAVGNDTVIERSRAEPDARSTSVLRRHAANRVSGG